jgi:hypothetical protein
MRHFAREKLSLQMDNRRLDARPGDVRRIVCALVCFTFEVAGSCFRFRTALRPEDSGITHDRIGKRFGFVVRWNSGECWNL